MVNLEGVQVKGNVLAYAISLAFKKKGRNCNNICTMWWSLFRAGDTLQRKK